MITNPNASIPTDSQAASTYAHEWLNKNYPDAGVEEIKTFYGYYTMDVSKNNQIGVNFHFSELL